MKKYLAPALVSAFLLGIGAATPSLVQAAYVEAHMNHAPYGTVKMVIPVTATNPQVWGMKLHNLANAEAAAKAGGGSVDARVVLYARGVEMLTQPMAEPLKKAIDGLRKAGVKFIVCNNSLQTLQIDWHSLYGVTEADIVPSGFLEIGWLANQGYAVEAMN
ncbi:MAG: DsrE family protein [Hyphomicrobiales bacterium]|nr:DsrE family protein [Hyphomicrobiales bacterium]MDE2113905.1 DsrE family protein [Hyphomicrobiales bacterium]